MIAFLYLFAAASTNLISDVYVALMTIAMANGDSKIVLDLPKTAWNLHLMGWNLKLFMASNVWGPVPGTLNTHKTGS